MQRISPATFLNLYRRYSATTKFAAHLPDYLAVRWARAESGLNWDVVLDPRKGDSTDERGIMSLSWAWAQTNGWPRSAFELTSSSPEHSTYASVAMMEDIARRVADALYARAPELAAETESFWYMVKLYHGLPLLFDGVTRPSNWPGRPPPQDTTEVVARARELGGRGPGSALDMRGRRGADWRGRVEYVLAGTHKVLLPSSTRTRNPNSAGGREDAALNLLLSR